MSTIAIEMGKARKPHTCECCGTAVESTHGFVYRDDDAFAVYQAVWCEGHPEDQINARIEIGGDWGDAEHRPEHAFFGVLIFRTAKETGFSMIEPGESMWSTEETTGKFLSREAALAHPLKAEIFHIAEHIATDDTRAKSFLNRHAIDV